MSSSSGGLKFKVSGAKIIVLFMSEVDNDHWSRGGLECDSNRDVT